jgi:antitoxin component of MazEF toxin-antitoxin module
MKKNFGENFQSIQVDPVTGNYYLIIPEDVANELSWYEDTDIKLTIEGNEVILCENTDV